MAKSGKLLEGEDFTEFSITFAKDTTRLCAETYAATQKPPGKVELQKLVERADAHVSEFHDLLRRYSGGRREAIQEIEHHIESLVEFVDTLKKTLAAKG
jgi:hypothetical protein